MDINWPELLKLIAEYIIAFALSFHLVVIFLRLERRVSRLERKG